MTLLVHDSCDGYTDETNFRLQRHVVSSSTVDVQSGLGRFGGNRLRIRGEATFGFAGANTIIWQSAMATDAGFEMHFQNGSGGQVQVNRGNDGSLIFRNRGTGTILGTTPGAIISGSGVLGWLSIKIFVHDTNGTIQVRKPNGSLILDLANVDTRSRAEDDLISSVNFFNFNSGGGPIIDDYMIFDTAGSAPFNDWTKDIGLRWLDPNAVGNHNDLTLTGGSGGNHYTAVNEANADGDTSKVSSANVGDRDTYGFSDLASNIGGTILAVSGVPTWKASDGGGREGGISVRNGGVTADAATTKSLEAGVYKTDRIIMLTDPTDSAAWTRAKVNSAEFGPKVSA
jgi:hypothetical protein